MQGMWFILAAALLTQLLWELPSITCTVQVVILSIIIPTCWRAAVGLPSPLTTPLPPTHLHSWSPARYWPPYPLKKGKGAGRGNCLLTVTDFSNSYSLSSSCLSLSPPPVPVYQTYRSSWNKIPVLHICLVEETAISSAELLHPSALFPRELIVHFCCYA